MSRNHLLIALLACCSANLARGQEEFISVEVWSPRPVYSKDARVEVIFRMSNASSLVLDFVGDYEWYSFPVVIFKVYKDGVKLLADVTDLLWKERTTLEDGESITVAFYLDRVAEIPEPAERVGLYRVKLARGVGPPIDEPWMFLPFVAAADLWFAVLDKDFESTLRLRGPVAEKDLPALYRLLRSESIWPAERLRILELLAETKNKRVFWQGVDCLLVATEDLEWPNPHYSLRWPCKDVYALVKVLPKLPRELLDPGRLYVLCRTTDLALRRAALKAMARCGPDKETATELQEFLDTQSDEMVQELGEKALSALKGQGR